MEDKRRESANRVLKTQVARMHDQLERVAETEAILSTRLAAQDRKMARLEGQVQQDKSSSRSTHVSYYHTRANEEMLFRLIISYLG